MDPPERFWVSQYGGEEVTEESRLTPGPARQNGRRTGRGWGSVEGRHVEVGGEDPSRKEEIKSTVTSSNFRGESTFKDGLWST